eukprot:CAMPEP_0185732086 /NCGR_PEP_ID=MMETSP1171-20130828/14926_1 /TAXON_ID=374046 /ORGANISM="Helicotheca tamensis, Strain CCMP826" /LENGTH=297 /DNA_ID=CAMNT_0028401487 /DNA_START=34 /DNA_END=927 /DNA_ORIENTATION=+
MEAPPPLTIDRLDEKEELILAQSTSQCCRCCCLQKTINWVLSEQDNFEPGTDPFNSPNNGWIHEESSLCGRWCSWILPGCREVKYVQHSGAPPDALKAENDDWCTVQKSVYTPELTEEDRNADIVGTHEKTQTCGYCFQFGDITFPVCNCFPLPYLETKNASGETVGKTVYVCDSCCFVPKYDVLDAAGDKKFRLRPDTCVAGLCVKCRCDGGKGKCCRMPFVIRDPHTHEPLTTAGNEKHAMVDVLWSGWKNECCTMKNAYHLAFPRGLTAEEKLLLTGSGLLVDLTMFEQNDDSD